MKETESVSPLTRLASLHERRIEVNHVNIHGIHFMCHDDKGENGSFPTFTSAQARELAAELLEAADDLDALLS